MRRRPREKRRRQRLRGQRGHLSLNRSRLEPKWLGTSPSLSLSLSSSSGHEGCLKPLGHEGPPMFMGALEVRETCLLPPDVFVGDSLSLSLHPSSNL